MRFEKMVSRRAVVGGLAAGAGVVAMPAVLRAQTLNWIGASATPPTDFIAQGLDVFAKPRRRALEGPDQGHEPPCRLARRRARACRGAAARLGARRVARPRAARRLVPPGRGLDASLPVQGRAAQEPRLGHDPRRVHPAPSQPRRSCAPIAAIPRMPRQLSCNKVVKNPEPT